MITPHLGPDDPRGPCAVCNVGRLGYCTRCGKIPGFEGFKSPSWVPTEAGVKHDAGKQDMTAIAHFPNALTKFAKVLDYGAKKYPSRDNWRAVPNLEHRYLAACIRHLFARIRGEKLDPESSLPHLACAMCCLAFILELGD